MASITTTTVLGKRKTRSKALLLHISASESSNEYSDHSYLDSESETPKKATQENFILVNGSLVRKTKKKYRCTFDGCAKVYSKPSRLEEHERSHTGERPFVCATCKKSYLRENHLQAHARSHLPESDRPLECSEPSCTKRFWTAQHLKVHELTHKGEKPWKCTQSGCMEDFSKHHQLRVHLSTAHDVEAFKPYECDHPGCTKSFSTNQKLRAHLKTHDDRRYTCSHPACTSSLELSYYPTWTALQSHIREFHPPTCPHPECNGKTFTQQKGLKAHLKLHEEKEAEADVQHDLEGDEDDEGMPRKKRRGGEYGRDWKCSFDGCDKDFKSKKSLNTHYNISHLGKRDFACQHENCSKSYGYKHLLQRHIAKAHIASSSSSESEEVEDRQAKNHTDIDVITGKSYERMKGSRAFRCPYPKLPDNFAATGSSTLRPCEHLFRRGYDLRRHMRSAHDIDLPKEVVDEWVKGMKNRSGDGVGGASVGNIT